MTQTLPTWLLAWRAAFTCVGLGLRDARHAGLWWRSALWCMAVVALWLGLYSCFGRFFVELSAMLALAAFFYVMVFIVGAIGALLCPVAAAGRPGAVRRAPRLVAAPVAAAFPVDPPCGPCAC